MKIDSISNLKVNDGDTIVLKTNSELTVETIDKWIDNTIEHLEYCNPDKRFAVMLLANGMEISKLNFKRDRKRPSMR